MALRASKMFAIELTATGVWRKLRLVGGGKETRQRQRTSMVLGR